MAICMIRTDAAGESYTLHPPLPEEAEAYASALLASNPEVDRLTGTTETFTQDAIVSYFMCNFGDDTRQDFMILDPDSHIIGESVINEIDAETRSANFRIAIFDSGNLGHGIGSWAVQQTVDYAFSELHLHRLSLDVFSYNPRAQHVYEKAGFVQEGVLRDAIIDTADGSYADDILMAILEDEWRSRKA